VNGIHPATLSALASVRRMHLSFEVPTSTFAGEDFDAECGAYSSREGLSTAFENFIGSYHRFLVAGQGRFTPHIFPCVSTVLLRVTLFTFLDATWWIGGNERYFFPVMPMYSCFLILLIYQSIAVWRRAGHQICMPL